MARLYAATGNSMTVVDLETRTCRIGFTGRQPQCVAVDPATPSTVYAGTRGDRLWRSSDSGQSWTACGLPADDVFSVAVSAADGAVYAGTEPSMLFVSRDEGTTWKELETLREIPSAPTWSFPPRPWTSHVRWVAPSPHDADLILAGIELGGVMRSEDGGATWSDHRPGAQKDAHELAWHPGRPGRAYEAAGGGAAQSKDGGLTWEAADSGRDRHYTWALAVDPADPDVWYISATYGPYDAHTDRPAKAKVYRWTEPGPWVELGGGLPDPLDSMPYALVTCDRSLIVGLRDGSLFETQDAGESWKRVELEGEAPARIVALASGS